MTLHTADWLDVYDAETREPTEDEHWHTVAALLTAR